MKFFFTALVCLVTTGVIQAQTGADAITGKWLNPDGTRKMEIYKSGDRYYGKIIWIDASVSTSKVKVGDVVLKEFAYLNGTWKGTVMVKGDSYTGSLQLSGNVLAITASYGFISKTKEWRRTGN